MTFYISSLEGILVSLPQTHADNDALFETLAVLREVEEVGRVALCRALF